MDTYLKALRALEPHEYAEAARQAVMRLTDAELLDHRIWCGDAEPKRRQREQDKAEAQAELVTELQQQHPELAPDYATTADTAETLADLMKQLPAWVQPTSKASAYPPMVLVKHGDKAWRARRLTDKQPGTQFDGWEDVTAHFLADAPVDASEQPEAEPKRVTPASQAEAWKAGEWYQKGDIALDNGTAYVSQRLHRATTTNRPSTGAKEWRMLPA